MSALVVDVGNLFVQKRSLQKAADAAALAATQSLDGSDCAPATPCNDTVAQLASDFNHGNDPAGSPKLPECHNTLTGVTENCYELINLAGDVCRPDLPPSVPPCVPVRVQVRVSRPVSLFFLFLIGKSSINVHAVARAFVRYDVTTIPAPRIPAPQSPAPPLLVSRRPASLLPAASAAALQPLGSPSPEPLSAGHHPWRHHARDYDPRRHYPGKVGAAVCEIHSLQCGVEDRRCKEHIRRRRRHQRGRASRLR